MPKKNKTVIPGTSSLKVKPKKRPGLIKQLSQPFLPSLKKSKSQDPVKLVSSAPREDEYGLFHGYDDMFLPDRNGNVSSMFMSPEKEVETYLKFDKTLLIKIPPREGKCSSTDSGYMSPPFSAESVTSPQNSTPAKGILKKKRSVSPDYSRCDSPCYPIQEQCSVQNGHVTPNPERAMSPIERAMSPIGMDSIENALGFLDDIIEEENSSKNVKKSVSFGELAEVKNFLSDSSDNDICDDIKPVKKNVSFGDVENIKRKKDECNKSFKKCVSFEDIYEPNSPVKSNADDDFLSRSVSCELLPLHDTDSSEDEVEKSVKENDRKPCGCDNICQNEVEVKVVDIRPSDKDEGQGQMRDKCTVIDSFNVVVSCSPFQISDLAENYFNGIMLFVVEDSVTSSTHFFIIPPKNCNWSLINTSMINLSAFCLSILFLYLVQN